MDLDNVDADVLRKLSRNSLVNWFNKISEGEVVNDVSIFRANYRGMMTAWLVLSAVVLTTGNFRVGLWAAIPTGLLTKQVNHYYLCTKGLPEDSSPWNVERVAKPEQDL